MKRNAVINIVKIGLGIVSGVGIGIVAGTLTGRFCDKENLSLAKKVAVLVGGAALGGALGDMAKNYTDSLIDDGVECYDAIAGSVRELNAPEEKPEEEISNG